MLIATRIIAPLNGSCETWAMPVRCLIIIFIGIFSSTVMPMPSAPETKPTIKVSALNTLEISLFDAPIALRIPISFVLSSTEI